MHFTVRVPDEVQLKVEFEIEDGGDRAGDRAHLVGAMPAAPSAPTRPAHREAAVPRLRAPGSPSASAGGPRGVTGKALAAVCALALAAAAVVLAIVSVVIHFPRGLVVLACVVLALAAGWYGLVRRGAARVAGLGVAALLGPWPSCSSSSEDPLLDDRDRGRADARAGRRAGGVPDPRRPARRARRRAPVLFYNPKSGGGKATRFDLPGEARARGIEPIELTLGADLETLVRDAVAAGADGLAMAGGDGSQAIVAAVAAEHGLPYACIPAGTRNHFALDLGVDRDDVVGALDAFVDGGERVVDLADVNGRIFVNNVSLGLYAEAVQRQGYREAKLRTILDMVPEVARSASGGLHLRCRGPGGHEHSAGAAILVSNNRYRLGRAVARARARTSTTACSASPSSAPPRAPARTDGPAAPWRRVDGARVRGRQRHGGGRRHRRRGDLPRAAAAAPIHPLALRVRIARQHPGASPSALQPRGHVGRTQRARRAWPWAATHARSAAGRRPPAHVEPTRRDSAV